MFNLPNGKVTPSQVLMPIGVVAFVVFISLGAQFFQNMRDRDGLHQAMVQQQKPFDEAQQLQNQLSALAVGTQQLANKGDKDAKAIIEKMNKIGIKVNVPPGTAMGRPGPGGPPPGRAPMGAAPQPAPPPMEESPGDR